MTAHFKALGMIGVTLHMVGCVDCFTESGMCYACCDKIRCEECHIKHRAAS